MFKPPLFVSLCVCVYASACVAFGGQVLSLLFSGSGKWLYYHTSLSWLLLHITDIRHCLHFCPRQLWVCGDHVRNFSGALGLIGCVSYISDKYTHLWKVAGNVSSLYHFILVLLTCNITTTQRSLYKCFRTWQQNYHLYLWQMLYLTRLSGRR